MSFVYRTTSTRWKDTLLTGEGARLLGGRWNLPGQPMVYTASSRSLAYLELLVHTGTEDIPDGLLMVTLEIPDELIATLAQLPDEWGAIPPQQVSMQWGSNWAVLSQDLALRVPSVVVPEETNVLINPQHPAITQVRIMALDRMDLDPRLLI